MAQFEPKAVPKKCNFWLAALTAGVKFSAMNCDLPSREEKLQEFLKTPQKSPQQWVQCKGYRCLATPTQDGKWVCFATGKELTDIIKVYLD